MLGRIIVIGICALAARGCVVGSEIQKAEEAYTQGMIDAAEARMGKMLADTLEIRGETTFYYNETSAAVLGDTNELLETTNMRKDSSTFLVTTDKNGDFEYELTKYSLTPEPTFLSNTDLGIANGVYRGNPWLLAGKRPINANLAVPAYQQADYEDVALLKEKSSPYNFGQGSQSIICVAGALTTAGAEDLRRFLEHGPIGDRPYRSTVAGACAVYEQVGITGDDEIRINDLSIGGSYKDYTDTRRLRRISQPFSLAYAERIRATAVVDNNAYLTDYTLPSSERNTGERGLAKRIYTFPAQWRL